MCWILYTDREYLKKKDCFDEWKCTNKLHQRRVNEKMIIAKCQNIINENKSLSKKNNNFHKYL